MFMDSFQSLARLPKHEKAWVKSLRPLESQNLLARQLEEIGFVPGEQVQVLSKAWMGGDPMVVRVGQSTFALRQAEAQLIEVTQEP
jgi:ferrous iron transport protein A